MTNELRSTIIINTIEANKNLDLRPRAAQIEQELRDGKREVVLRHFDRLISINHAKLHGLGTDHHADRDGGWGFSERDDQFLSSLRMQFLGNAYGIMNGPGRWVSRPLSVKQVAALARCLARPFYTLQLALVELQPVPASA